MRSSMITFILLASCMEHPGADTEEPAPPVPSCGDAGTATPDAGITAQEDAGRQQGTCSNISEHSRLNSSLAIGGTQANPTPIPLGTHNALLASFTISNTPSNGERSLMNAVGMHLRDIPAWGVFTNFHLNISADAIGADVVTSLTAERLDLEDDVFFGYPITNDWEGADIPNATTGIKISLLADVSSGARTGAPFSFVIDASEDIYIVGQHTGCRYPAESGDAADDWPLGDNGANANWFVLTP